jgi:hypothetical protein
MADSIMYHGEEVERDYPARVAAAQQETTYRINGNVYQRVPYRASDFFWPDSETAGSKRGVSICYDCLVEAGNFHVPGCALEECPACGGFIKECPCAVEGRAPGDRSSG